MRILLRISFHARVSSGGVIRLARSTTPLVKVVLWQILRTLAGSSAQLEPELSRESREVAGLPQTNRIGRFPELLRERTVVEVATVTVLVEPRHDVDSTSHADRGGVVVVIKRHSRLRQAVDVRRLHVLVSVAPKRVTGLVVGKEKDDVGTRLLAEGQGYEQERQKENRAE